MISFAAHALAARPGGLPKCVQIDQPNAASNEPSGWGSGGRSGETSKAMPSRFSWAQLIAPGIGSHPFQAVSG